MTIVLLLLYDVRPSRREAYFQFFMGEFVPQAQAIGLILKDDFMTIYGDFPGHLVSLVTTDRETLDMALESQVWAGLEARMEEFVTGYSKRAVKLKPGRFQFFVPDSA